MPYTTAKEGEQTCVYKKGADGEPTGDTLGCHDTPEEAQAQIAALMAKEGEGDEGEHAAPAVQVRMLRAYVERAGMSEKPGEPMRFVASTEDIARDGGVVAADGWQLDSYRANPVFLWAHDYSTLPLGRADVEVKDGRLMATVEFDQADDFARQVEGKYRRGYLNAVSVGWNTLEYADGRALPEGARWMSLKHELLDISAVPVPADPMALAERQRALMREWARSIMTDETPQPAPPEGEPVWSDVAAAMVAVCARAGDEPEEARLERYRALLPKYRKLGKTAPEWLDAADVTALGPAEKRGLFLAGELDVVPDAFPEPEVPPAQSGTDDGAVEAALVRVLARLSAPSAHPSPVYASLRGLLARLVAALPASSQAPAATPEPESLTAATDAQARLSAAGGDDGQGSADPDSSADTPSILARLREHMESQWTPKLSSRTSTTA